ncbi:hypothetical protein [Massilia soli]|nr:hypothetical protein [Massilia soli]
MKSRTLIVLALSASCSSSALADWYYRSFKVECSRDQIAVIDYSAYNEAGEARLLERNVIDVDKLSTWRTTEDDLNVPDKPLPHRRECKMGGKKYSIVLTNQSNGGYSPPVPVVNITNTTNPRRPIRIVSECALYDMPEGETKIVLSISHPQGQFFRDGKLVPDAPFRKPACGYHEYQR